MKCSEAKSLFSPYLDGAVSGRQMQELDRHLQGCAGCNREYISLRQVQQLLSKMGPRRAPADLALKLRVAISREAAGIRPPYWTGIAIRLENAVNAFMVPAMAGLTTAVVIFGLLMGFLALPTKADTSADVPLGLTTDPQLQQSAFGTVIDSVHGDALVIEAYVDPEGRVQDYRILSNPSESQDLLPQLKNMLIFTTFRPATSMGRPTSGRAVLSFSKISVKG
jgi:anti-sigma factor RsiW